MCERERERETSLRERPRRHALLERRLIESSLARACCHRRIDIATTALQMAASKALLLAAAFATCRCGGADGADEASSRSSDRDTVEDGWTLPVLLDRASPVERVVYVTLVVLGVACLCWTARWLARQACCTKYTEINDGGIPSDSARDGGATGSGIGTRLCKSSTQQHENEYLM